MIRSIVKAIVMFDFNESQAYVKDEMNSLPIYEISEAKNFTAMHPSQAMLSYKKPEVGTAISLTDQAIIMLNTWMQQNGHEIR